MIVCCIGTPQLMRWMKNIAKSMHKHQEELTELDRAIGDADHGINMARGFDAVMKELPTLEAVRPALFLQKVGMILLSSIGGVSGPLYGTFFIKGAAALEEGDALDAYELLAFLKTGTKALSSRGRAIPGDKTMYDVLRPAVVMYEASINEGMTLEDSLLQALKQAAEAVGCTVDMLARKGRASYLGERSIGHQDPGATSAYYMLEALCKSVDG